MNRPDPERAKATILRICLVVWLLCCIAMGVLAYVRHAHPDSPWARWEAAARQAEVAHLQRLQAQGEQDYIQFAQHVCGPETWWLQRPDGTRVCTTKRGRPTGHQLAGANP